MSLISNTFRLLKRHYTSLAPTTTITHHHFYDTVATATATVTVTATATATATSLPPQSLNESASSVRSSGSNSLSADTAQLATDHPGKFAFKEPLAWCGESLVLMRIVFVRFRTRLLMCLSVCLWCLHKLAQNQHKISINLKRKRSNVKRN